MRDARTPTFPSMHHSRRPLFSLCRLLLIACFAGCTRSARRSGPESAFQPAPSGLAATLAAAPDQFFTSGDVTLRYRDLGRGDAVVLIHGFSSSLEGWGAVADSLAVDHRVIALDMRGFGRSTKSADPARYGRETPNDIPRLLDHLGVRRAHVVGHSMGALVAAHVAARFSDRIASATFAAGPFRDSTGLQQLLHPFADSLQGGGGLRAFYDWIFPAWSDSVVGVASRASMARNDLGSLIAVLRSSPRLAADSALFSTSRVPALIVVGSADPVAEDSRRLARWWPGARLVVVPNADHNSVLFPPALMPELRRRLEGR